jgi:hypothetical protein
MIAVIFLPPLPVLRERVGVRALGESHKIRLSPALRLSSPEVPGEVKHIRNHFGFLPDRNQAQCDASENKKV